MTCGPICNFTLKQHPMTYEDLEDFIQCYHPENRYERHETWSQDNPDGRWRRFTPRRSSIGTKPAWISSGSRTRLWLIWTLSPPRRNWRRTSWKISSRPWMGSANY